MISKKNNLREKLWTAGIALFAMAGSTLASAGG